MQGNKQSKPVTRLFRVFFRFLLTLVTMYGVLYLSLLAVTVLMRLKWVNDKVRLLSSRLGNMTFLAAYPLDDGSVFTLAYGPHVDWCRNIMASGKCTLTWKGHEYALEKPELLPISEAWVAYPLSTRPFIMAGGMKQCLWLHRQSEVLVPVSYSSQISCDNPHNALH